MNQDNSNKKKSAPFAGLGFIDKFLKAQQVMGVNSKLLFLLIKIRDYFLFRIAYFSPLNSIRVLCNRWRGVKIGKDVLIGFNCVLDHSYPGKITLEDNCALSGEVYILVHSRPDKHFQGKLMSYVAGVTIKEGAWLGIRTTILPGVIIGRNSIVSAGSVVSENIPDNSIVQGNPAKIIGQL